MLLGAVEPMALPFLIRFCQRLSGVRRRRLHQGGLHLPSESFGRYPDAGFTFNPTPDRQVGLSYAVVLYACCGWRSGIEGETIETIEKQHRVYTESLVFLIHRKHSNLLCWSGDIHS